MLDHALFAVSAGIAMISTNLDNLAVLLGLLQSMIASFDRFCKGLLRLSLVASFRFLLLPLLLSVLTSKEYDRIVRSLLVVLACRRLRSIDLKPLEGLLVASKLVALLRTLVVCCLLRFFDRFLLLIDRVSYLACCLLRRFDRLIRCCCPQHSFENILKQTS